MKNKKEGSAIIFVLLIISAIITIVAGLLQVSLLSLKQSNNYYNKNASFYYGENALESIIYYLDLVADDARDKANRKCFAPGGGPNLDDEDVEKLYGAFLNEYDNADKNIEEEKKAKDRYELKIKGLFINDYRSRLRAFFQGNGDLTIKNFDGERDFSGDWASLKQELNHQFINSRDDFKNVEIEFAKYDEVSDLWGVKGNGEDRDFQYYGTEKDSLDSPNIRDTIYIRAHIKDKNVTRYMVSTFEFNPFGKNIKDVSIKPSKINKGYNRVLDYAVLSGRNIVVVNADSIFKVNGDVYARGTSNRLDATIPSENFGGIVAGLSIENLNALKQKDRINSIPSNTLIGTNSVPLRKGNIVIDGNAYIGDIGIASNSSEEYIKYKLSGGFAKTGEEYSSLNIKKDLYCHSIVTEENSKEGYISVEGNAYISGVAGLYGDNSDISILNSLIGYELGDDGFNYNSSPSIIVNNESAHIYIGNNVVLFGVAYVDGIKNKDGKIFRTVDTSSINPNFLAYSYVNESDPNFVDDYILGNSELSIKMFSRDKGYGQPNKTINYLLKYITKYVGSIGTESEYLYDAKYNFGYNNENKRPIIEIPNLKIDPNTPYDTSYFPFIMVYNDGNSSGIHIARNMSGDTEYEENEEKIKNEFKNKYFYNGPKDGMADLEKNLRDGLLKDEKTQFIKKIKFEDKGLAAYDFPIADGSKSYFERYFNWDVIEDEDIFIKDNNRKTYINISKHNIDLDVKEVDGYNVMLISGGDIYINNTSQSKASISGNVIAKGDIAVQGSSIDINWKDSISKRLMNYFNSEYKDECNRMYSFFSKGTSEDGYEIIEIPGTFQKTVRTNINILSRRQILK